MKRYRIEGGIPVAPPRNGVDAKGNAITNFDRYVERDATFAAENGYYPIVEEPPRAGCAIKRVTYEWRDGAWHRTVLYR